jgi:hypothetical protein
VDSLKIVAADSSAALLNEKFEPLSIVAAASALVNPPYKEASTYLAERIFVDALKGHEVIVHEAELCRDLLGKVKADVVHLDMSLNGISLEELSPVELTNMRISIQARQHLLRVLPRLRKIAAEITRKYCVDVLAIGKESIPVRIAELTGGANAILFACERVIEKGETVLLGLPSRCQSRLYEKGVSLHSLIPAEHDAFARAEDVNAVLNKVNIFEMLNPIARGFRALRITSKMI